MAEENNTETTPEPTLEVEPTPEGATVEGEPTVAETQKTLPPLTLERLTDITLGLGKAAFEKLDDAARQLDDSVRTIRADTPKYLQDLEEKGRPVREKLRESLRGVAPSVTDVFTRATHKPETPAGETSAVDEITALENRVRELEQQVSTEAPADAPAAPDAPSQPSPFSMLELDDDLAAPDTAEPAAEPEAEAPKRPRGKRKSDDTSES